MFIFKDFIYLFLDRGEGKEKERERNIHVWLPLVCPLLGTWPAIQEMWPDWESNLQPFGSQANTQSTEPPQPEREEQSVNQNVEINLFNDINNLYNK